MWRKMGKTVPWVKMIPIFVSVVYAIVNDDIKMT